MNGKIKLNGTIPVLGAYDYRADQNAAFPSIQLCRHTGYQSMIVSTRIMSFGTAL